MNPDCKASHREWLRNTKQRGKCIALRTSEPILENVDRSLLELRFLATLVIPRLVACALALAGIGDWSRAEEIVKKPAFENGEGLLLFVSCL
jgi:hypothetical protein